MKNRKGFTLIELLAVVIILGILMIIAVPAVSQYIDDSKKNSYISSAKHLGGGARNIVNSGKYDLTDPNTTYYLDVSCINSENDLQSPYADYEKAYVAVTFNDDHYEYFWTSVDKAGIGVKDLTEINKLGIDSIVTNIDPNEIKPDIGIDGRGYVVTILGSACTKSAPEPADKVLNVSTGKIKNGCTPATDTIYWALQDTNSDSRLDKLVISDSEVTGGQSGSFSSSSVFNSSSVAPWISYDDYYTINSIDVSGRVAPLNTAYWFYYAGSDSYSFSANLSNLDVCNVTDMNNMFYLAGTDAQSFSLSGLNSWDTSKVTNMTSMFNATGRQTSSYSLDLSNWDLSSVTSMDAMFNAAGYQSNTVNINLSGWVLPSSISSMFSYSGQQSSSFKINISNWNTSNVTNMGYLFNNAGRDATTWEVKGLNNLNTSKVTNMSYMFNEAAENASVSLDLSKWDVSNVLGMGMMFNQFGKNGGSVSLNLNGWNLPKVGAYYDMFKYLGDSSTSLSLNISNWNLSNISSASSLLSNIGKNANTVNINASGLNLSSATQAYEMFAGTGQYSSTFNLNLSGLNISNCNSMGYMFNNTGINAQTFNITIPKTNGNGVNNTANALYGDNSHYASAPLGKSFTLANN